MKKIITVTLLLLCLLATTAYAEINTKALIDLIDNHYYGAVNIDELQGLESKEIFKKLDKYCKVYTSEEIQNIVNCKQNYKGIGVKLSLEDNRFIIKDVLKGYSAFEAGVKVGDEIIAISEEKIEDKPFETVVNMIANSKKERLVFEIKREEKIVSKEIKLESVNLNKKGIAKVQILKENTAYVKINAFEVGVSGEFEKILLICKKTKVRNIIIDVRGNSGGILGEVVDILRQLCAKGKVLNTLDNHNNITTYYSYLEEKPFNVAVLVDSNSASASEILAIVVKETNTGVVIGEKTYGKGLIQRVFKNDDGDYIKLTTGEYFPPNMNAIEGIGVIPDITCKDDDIMKKAQDILVKEENGLNVK